MDEKLLQSIKDAEAKASSIIRDAESEKEKSVSKARKEADQFFAKEISEYEKKKALEDEEADLGREEKTLMFLKEAGISSFDQLSGYATLEMACGYLKKPVALKEAIVFSANREKS